MNSIPPEKRPFEERLEESKRIKEKYPDRTPIVLIPKNINFDKVKYLVPNELHLNEFIYVLRKRIHLRPEQALFCFVNGSIPHSGEAINTIYERERHADGFLYIEITPENTFG